MPRTLLTTAAALLVGAVGSVVVAAPVLAQCGPIETQKLLAGDGGIGDKFGFSVDMSGDVAVFGAIQHDHVGPSSGGAYVFTWSGDRWLPQAELVGADTDVGDWFGYSVAIHGDTILVGARNDDDRGGNSGSVYVFGWDGATWNQEAKLLASDGADTDLFGFSVALDGDTAAIGAPNVNRNVGAVYVFVRSAGAWSEQQKLMPSDGAILDEFGTAVALEGDTLAGGSIGDDDRGDKAGAAYVFVRRGTTWTEEAKLTASDGDVSDNFARSLALQGDTLLVGVPGDDDRGATSGSVYVFEGAGNTWREAQKLVASDGVANAQLGESVALDGEVAVLGAWNDTTSHSATGSAYVFVRSGKSWVEYAKLLASDRAQSDNLGGSLAVVGNAVVVGAQNDDDLGNNSGSVYAFDLRRATWANYGAGWPGTNGVPGLTASDDPALGSSITLVLENSLGQTTTGLVMLGLVPTSVPTRLGGTLLVQPLSSAALPIPAAGLLLPLAVPPDPALCGLSAYLQALELDPGASRRVSFTAGLELELGD